MIDYCQIQTSQGMIRGTIHNYSTLKKDRIIVLLLHGYLSSNRIGPNRLYYRLANAIVDTLNITVARFDCHGMGESDGDLINITFNDFIQSYQSIINYYLKECKNTKFLLIGHCIGANIVPKLTSLYPSNIFGAVLISPTLTDEHSLSKFFSIGEQSHLEKKGHTVRKGINVDSSFFLGQNLADNVISNISSLSCHWYLIIGSEDQFFNYFEAKNKLPSSHIIEIENADHNYLGLSERALLIEICIDCLSKLLKKYNI